MAEELPEFCSASNEDGALAALITEEMMVDGLVEEILKVDCGEADLLSLFIEKSQGENLELAVIDMGLDVHKPAFLTADGSRQSLIQVLESKADSDLSMEVRAFALEYMNDFQDSEFNPALVRGL